MSDAQTEKQSDIEGILHKAAYNGDLAMVIYLIEQCHSDVEA